MKKVIVNQLLLRVGTHIKQKNFEYRGLLSAAMFSFLTHYMNAWKVEMISE